MKAMPKKTCEYSKPYANPPIHCSKEATKTIEFNIGKMELCQEHYTHFWQHIFPYLDERS